MRTVTYVALFFFPPFYYRSNIFVEVLQNTQYFKLPFWSQTGSLHPVVMSVAQTVNTYCNIPSASLKWTHLKPIQFFYKQFLGAQLNNTANKVFQMLPSFSWLMINRDVKLSSYISITVPVKSLDSFSHSPEWQSVPFPFPLPPCCPLHHVLLQEEESPDNSELRRAESSPTPLKRDRSFSEHDLALLRGEMLPSLSEVDGVVRLRGERPRSRTLTGAGPPPYHRGQYISRVKITLLMYPSLIMGVFVLFIGLFY